MRSLKNYRLAKRYGVTTQELLEAASVVETTIPGTVMDGIVNERTIEDVLDEFRRRGYDDDEAIRLVIAWDREVKDV